MQLKKLTNLGTRYLIHRASEELYLKTGIDTTKPFSINIEISNRCNYKCQYCDHWRSNHYPDELTIPEWKQALLSLKKFVGPYTVQFSGGEVFVKKGFIDLLQFCHQEGIEWGLITNGSAFINHGVVKKVVAAKPMNIDISIDGANPEVHDLVRGVPNSLNNIIKGIGILKQEMQKQKVKFPIRIKPTVNFYNFHSLPKIVDLFTDMGATTIDFSPVRPLTSEVKENLWLSKSSDIEKLQEVVETLITMKKNGSPIETSEEKLRSFPDHFLGKAVNQGISPCHIGLREYYMNPNGDVNLCWLHPVIGNVKTQTAREIWYGELAKKNRIQTVKCQKFGSVDCANSCMTKRSFKQEIKRGLLFFNK
ncbi:radical SAM/SPASM domain-containing protein [Candidatus Marithrix sp. Canyon 246]|uniref:radical SAM/SPASM domain-containing protein n=1 Tax=Candidatus Marithrix sp. Canyon 246 TaxID=1827136 RepID=UPI000849F535|nr:radical SAM protein [Candidatus Marithrix sp. Canyon 246]